MVRRCFAYFTDVEFLDSVLEIAWRDNNVFASCSMDKDVIVSGLDEEKRLAVFSGHKDDVQSVEWSPNGELLASCSVDCTARVCP